MRHISSVDTDPKRSTSCMYYGCVDIKDGRVQSISEELGSEGKAMITRKPIR